MKVLVTGGAGFIGSWVIRQLLADPDISQVINLDALTYAGNLENLVDVANHPNYQFVHGDIGDFRLVSSLMQQVEGCIHAAAETHVDRSITQPFIFTQTNVLGTQVLLEAAKQTQLKRFVLVSTDEVYGSLSLNTPDVFTEQSPLKPNSPYAASKASADMLGQAYYETFGLPVMITRCGNNYGPYQYPEKLIPFFILRAKQGKTLPVYGDGLNVRDWIHVADHARALITVLKQGRSGSVYNVGANRQRANLEMTQALLTCLGLPKTQIEFVADRPGHDRRYALDASKIQKELGWQPQYDLDSALSETIAWYDANTSWLENILKRQQQEKIPEGATWLNPAS